MNAVKIKQNQGNIGLGCYVPNIPAMFISNLCYIESNMLVPYNLR